MSRLVIPGEGPAWTIRRRGGAFVLDRQSGKADDAVDLGDQGKEAAMFRAEAIARERGLKLVLPDSWAEIEAENPDAGGTEDG